MNFRSLPALKLWTFYMDTTCALRTFVLKSFNCLTFWIHHSYPYLPIHPAFWFHHSYYILPTCIITPPIFVPPVFSCINETMVYVFYCFDYDVTFSSIVNLEDDANDRHKKKREMCLKKVANTSNTYPYTKRVIFRNVIFCIFTNSMFSPQNLANALNCLASARTVFQVCVTLALKNSEAPTINYDGI